MHHEIERKFLVRKDLWYAVHKPAGTGMIQGYLVLDDRKTIRVRVTETGGWLTIKGPAKNATRLEYEISIPRKDALEILENFTGSRIEKNRYRIEFEKKIWEVDEFYGENDGLILAEIELKSEDEPFIHPQWLGEEVTTDLRYTNAFLAVKPVSSWEKK
jgi:adenylate cyclase